MMFENNSTEQSVIAKISFIACLLGIGLMVIFCALVTIGMDFGIFVFFSLLFFVVAFVLGIISAIGIFIFRRRTGMLYSLASIILSLPIVFVASGIFMTRNVREEKKKTHTALYNMELLADELEKYAENNGGYLPDADNWCDSLMEHNSELTEENFRHPQPDFIKLKGECHIAFNSSVGGERLADISPDTILLFEADGGWNLNGTSNLLNSKYGEKLFARVLYLDGSENSYWYDRKAIRKFKSKLGKSYMYYESPNWGP